MGDRPCHMDYENVGTLCSALVETGPDTCFMTSADLMRLGEVNKKENLNYFYDLLRLVARSSELNLSIFKIDNFFSFQAEDYRLAEIVDAEGEIRDVAPAPPPKQEPEEEVTEVPSKCVSVVRTVSVKASVQYIELEGRCDGESLLRLVAHAKPRAIVGLRANETALMTLSKHCQNEGIEKIFTPNRGDIIDATTESHIYQVKLTDSLMSDIVWRKAGDAELAWLSATVAARPHQRETDATTEDTSSDVVMSLEPCAGAAHAASFVNSVRLSELRAAVAKLGLSAEFSQGALECCNGTLAIRRLENGRVALEGVLSEEYYKVRELLYDQFAIV
ncbi:probable cleavage and polyadenylation specificity factor subunit 2 [Ostrinia furnacalis]|uniref:probable cleavage and polyadenylation specificity factor subunit 2 n=1 Tax=Ostrinia furnacalis TaxID=93504 RepID=UPI00103E0F9A|nr:probable cleavage and polyadenylation specificity factor subunit 2 [Ostrinia furnacalis]